MKNLVLGLSLVLILTGCRYKPEPERVGDEFGAAATGLQYGTCKDCIPAIDRPWFESKEAANKWLEDEDLVLGLDYQGEHEAYPVKILNWHEVINDPVKLRHGASVVVTYSALCGSAAAFKSEAKWGVSGRLKQGCLVMYDKSNNELVSQIDNGLEQVPVQVLSWGEWSGMHPATTVLSPETGFDRNYEMNPYPELDQAEVVYRVKVGEETKTYGLEEIKRETAADGVFVDTVGGEKIRLSYSQGEILVENLKTKQPIIPLRQFRPL